MRRVRVSSHLSPVHKLGDSQMKLTPKFRLAMTPSPLPYFPAPVTSKLSEEPAAESLPLIPGLPDDVALNCLLRLPVAAHVSCRLVCRRWHRLLANKECFFSQRKALGFSDPWVFTLAFHRCTGKIQWKVFDLAHLSWHTIPDMPCRDRVCPRGFRCIAIPPNGTLLVCGGLVSDVDCPLHLVLKYEIHRNRWTVMSRMLNARSFFAGGVIDGRVYVAGGYSTDQFELDSAETLDPVNGNWRPVASMGMNMASFDSAVFNGRLYVTEGCVWPFVSFPRGQVYDPKTNIWERMPVGMREGWMGSSVVIAGHLFVISELERMRLKVYDPELDSWDTVDGASLPERIHKPLSVTSIGSKIVVVGRGLHVAIGQVDDEGFYSASRRTKKHKFAVRWLEVDAVPEFSDLTPSSAQVLYA